MNRQRFQDKNKPPLKFMVLVSIWGNDGKFKEREPIPELKMNVGEFNETQIGVEQT